MFSFCIRRLHCGGIGRTPPVSALDDAGVELIRRRLANSMANRAPHRFRYKAGASEAAVLLLLCTEKGRPCILFEERQRRLLAHGGEVCFAGGKADSEDPTLVHTALRETREELGLDPSLVRVLGRMPPVPSKNGLLRVHPVVGVVGELGGLRLNREEVHRAFALPVSHFYEGNEVAEGFRDTGLKVPVYQTDKRGLSIWGLTAYILNEFLIRVGDPANDVVVGK
ncbi:hypothetical protein GGH91_001201 [Coemansia sp. RSA 2671]|nr:hypothetical protein LPJ60_003371 [Coemansia sp. RSA 2675]KAJ2030953.1 hypothetical protein IWW57_000936 [Coemansia sp. S610]KAJ2348769.1 hypothetical protein GGH91_001201 [Coemansia sp. RSA 2671]